MSIEGKHFEKFRRVITAIACSVIISNANASLTSSGEGKSNQVDAVFDQLIVGDSPGCAVGIYQDHKIIYSQGYGLANIENDVSITPQSVFDIGSTSKQFTAAAIIKLQQQGKISIEDDVREYLPELPKYDKIITIRHLLNHTSGLRDYIQLMTLAGFDIDDVTTAEDAYNIVVRQKSLNFDPGSEFLYSNTGYFLASLIVERVSGKSLKEFADEHYFSPLGMRSTTYVNSHKQLLKNRASAYNLSESNTYLRDVSYWEQNGDGAVFTTVEDLLAWDSVFYSEQPTYQSLKKSLYKKGVLNDGSEQDYALGLTHSEYKTIKLVQHGGAWGGYRAQLIRAPEHKFSVAILCNLASFAPTVIARKIIDIYLSDHIKNNSTEVASTKKRKSENIASMVYQPKKIDSKRLKQYVGSYEFSDYPGNMIEVLYQDGNFSIAAPDEPVTSLVSASDILFIDDKGKAVIEFELDQDNNAVGGMWYQPGSRQAYQLSRITPYHPKKNELMSLTGRFYSEELNVYYDMQVEGEVLQSIGRTGKSVELEFVARNRLISDSFQLPEIRIQFDINGQVSSFSISVGRSKNLLFNRIDSSLCGYKEQHIVDSCSVGKFERND